MVPATQIGPPELLELAALLVLAALLEAALRSPPVPLDDEVMPPAPEVVVPAPPLPPVPALLLAVVLPLAAVVLEADDPVTPPVPPVPGVPPPLVPVPIPSLKSSRPRIIPHPLGASARANEATK
jgi:hypothetical protein